MATGSERLAGGRGGLLSLSATLTARPTRLCVLVPLWPGFAWEVLVEHAIAAQTSIWGGHANLIVPFDDQVGSEEIFWQLLQSFDPDMIGIHIPRLSDIEGLAPDVYRETVNGLIAQLEAAGFRDPGVQATEIERLGNQVFRPWRLPADLSSQLINWIAPLHHAEHLRTPTFDGVNPPPNGFTDVSKIVEIPTSVANIRTSTGALDQLMLTNQIGRLLPSLSAELRAQRGVEIQDLELTREHELALHRWGDTDQQTAYPFSLSTTGLHRRVLFELNPSRIVVVSGDGPRAFLLFHGLQRLRPNVFWLPERRLADDAYLSGLRAVLTRAAESVGEAATPISVVALADGDADAASAALGARDQHFPGSETSDWRTFIPRQPFWVADARSQRTVPLLISNGQSHELPTPIPLSIATSSPFDTHWIVDIEVQGWAPRRDPTLGATLVAGAWINPHEARIGSLGCSYAGLSAFLARGLGFENALARPRLSPRPLIDQLQNALQTDGSSVRLSDKGAYAERSAALFGGVQPLAEALRDEATRAILDAYLDPGGPGMHLTDTRRSYLTYAEARHIAGQEQVERVITSLYDNGVLERGHALKCDHCRATSFYSLSEDQEFTCRRCRTTRRATRWNWLKAEPGQPGSNPEPEFRYALAEVVYQFLRNRGDLPLLGAHDYFLIERARERQSFDVAFELELLDGNEIQSEHDIVVSWGTDLWLGEATSLNYLEHAGADEQLRLERLKSLADRLSARGILFVTEAKTFRQTTKGRITAAFEQAHPRPSVVFLEGFVTRP